MDIATTQLPISNIIGNIKYRIALPHEEVAVMQFANGYLYKNLGLPEKFFRKEEINKAEEAYYFTAHNQEGLLVGVGLLTLKPDLKVLEKGGVLQWVNGLGNDYQLEDLEELVSMTRGVAVFPGYNGPAAYVEDYRQLDLSQFPDRGILLPYENGTGYIIPAHQGHELNIPNTESVRVMLQSYQHMGIGTVLTTMREEKAIREGFKINYSIARMPASEKMYEKLGYEVLRLESPEEIVPEIGQRAYMIKNL
jgi:hypothetical protein